MARAAPRKFPIVVIGASAGGVDPLMQIARSLRSDMSAAIFVVVHTGATSSGVLPDLLDGASRVSASRARHNAEIEPGRIYVAPPDYHLTLADGGTRLNHGPRENGFRPAVDPLFRSAASAFGPRVVGIVLSGGMNDGTHGLLAIKRAGGIAVAQEPAEALNPSMPLSAVRHADPDYVLTAGEIGALINQLDHKMARPRPTREGRKPRAQARGKETPASPGTVPAGTPTTLTCPECGGTLWEQRNGELARYECRVGHAFTDTALTGSQARRLEAALWTAVRVLEESAAYLRRLGDRARRGRLEAIAERYEARALNSEQQAELLLDILARPRAQVDSGEPPAPATPPAPQSRAVPGPSPTTVARQSSRVAESSKHNRHTRRRAERGK